STSCAGSAKLPSVILAPPLAAAGAVAAAAGAAGAAVTAAGASVGADGIVAVLPPAGAAVAPPVAGACPPHAARSDASAAPPVTPIICRRNCRRVVAHWPSRSIVQLLRSSVPLIEKTP